MLTTSRLILAALLVLLEAPGAQAQVAVSLLTRLDRYWGGTAATQSDGTVLRLRPFRPDLFGARLSYTTGATRIGVGAGLSWPNYAVEGSDGNAISFAGSNKQLELDVEFARRLLRAGDRARVWGYVSPLLSHWQLDDSDRWSIGGAVGLEFEVDLTRSLAMQSRVSLAAQSAAVEDSALPEGTSNGGIYRRSIGIGVRYRL